MTHYRTIIKQSCSKSHVRAFTSYKKTTNVLSETVFGLTQYSISNVQSSEFLSMIFCWWCRRDCSQSQFYEEIKMTSYWRESHHLGQIRSGTLRQYSTTVTSLVSFLNIQQGSVATVLGVVGSLMIGLLQNHCWDASKRVLKISQYLMNDEDYHKNLVAYFWTHGIVFNSYSLIVVMVSGCICVYYRSF